MAYVDPFAKATENFRSIMKSIKERKFLPVYLLCGQETYFTERIVKALSEEVLTPDQRDFNQSIIYATDGKITADGIVSLCRRYPVFADYQVIIVKEAQALTKTENLAAYMQHPIEHTLLVLAYSKEIDKRTTFGKQAKNLPGYFESAPLKEGYAASWISGYTKEQGMEIDEEAARLLGEYIGTNLNKIVLELDKLYKSLPDGTKRVTLRDVEVNTGMSREFSAFELCAAIGSRDAATAYKIAHYMGENSKKYPIQMTLGALFFYYSRVLKAYGYIAKERVSHSTALQKAGIYAGQVEEYSKVLRNYTLPQVMKIIAKIKECDYKSKSNSRGNSTDGELLCDFILECLH